ncbi:hypothetical protein CEXT_240061 [Caerostris extrusa]|uniref:Uncharacterized protein n=1 Tax=Caerostris extrusa TaxID=172846 RepID=A0AAV4PUA0_CAEEX|nr:hypothetical protein CEXT_240061 [Caerostris extrusa]
MKRPLIQHIWKHTPLLAAIKDGRKAPFTVPFRNKTAISAGTIRVKDSWRSSEMLTAMKERLHGNWRLFSIAWRSGFLTSRGR